MPIDQLRRWLCARYSRHRVLPEQSKRICERAVQFTQA